MLRHTVPSLIAAAFTALTFVIAPPCSAQGPFAGTWTVTRSQDAPWLAKRPELKPFPRPVLRNARFVFSKDRVVAPEAWMACKKPRYEMMSLGFDALFESGLADPDKGLNDPKSLALALGFTSEPVPSMLAGCSELLFHLVDKNTAQFALDNMIYTLQRQPPK